MNHSQTYSILKIVDSTKTILLLTQITIEIMFPKKIISTAQIYIASKRDVSQLKSFAIITKRFESRTTDGQKTGELF